jgi:TolB-like protein/DNA-binding winged helix-turn-helix (wHTH) protein
MENPERTMLQVGSWRVNRATGEISRNGEVVRLEGRAMLLLMCLAERAGEVVSVDELLNRVWSGVIVSPDSVYQAVASLRRQLGDDAKQPTYIATVPRLGYRMVATVTALPKRTESGGISGNANRQFRDTESARMRRTWLVLAVMLVGAGIVIAFFFLVRDRVQGSHGTSAVLASQNQKSVAVLPFLDLTDGMKEEEFADGMTEELIDRLSKIPDFRVPAPTASFYYKNKQASLAEIGSKLGVVYVLDGSVRKSAARFRVAARLVRAENGYVMWSETYDRPLVDKLLVQEDIAGEVTKALQISIHSGAGTSQAR